MFLPAFFLFTLRPICYLFLIPFLFPLPPFYFSPSFLFLYFSPFTFYTFYFSFFFPFSLFLYVSFLFLCIFLPVYGPRTTVSEPLTQHNTPSPLSLCCISSAPCGASGDDWDVRVRL
jgi:hypothetical protein